MEATRADMPFGPIVSRRSVLAATLALPFGATARVPPPTADIVVVREGALRGSADGAVRRFLGIPYASPPTGARRFLPPAPPVAWRGVRDATRFGDAPLQPDPSADIGMSAREYLGADMSEDCLKLNVWAPAAPGRYPVLVWIHGGSNDSGSAAQDPLDGTGFARAGIVCVTVGYRVGALGFLELGGLLGGAYRGSGLNGLRDQIAALRWVRANIARFGGDPARVTLGGESAGAKNVLALIASPLAAGLFRYAIVESGGETVHTPADAEAVARLFAAACIAEHVTPDALPTLDPAHLLRIQQRAVAGYDRPFAFRAIVGSDVLPVAPVAAFRHGAGADVRLLIGTNRDESILFLDPASARRPLAQRDLANRPVADVAAVERRYAVAFPALDPLRRRVRVVTAEEYGLATYRIAEAHRHGAAGTWLYRFAHETASGPFAGWVPHAAELPFVWGKLDGMLARFTGGDDVGRAAALATAIQQRWHAFIHGRDPWPRYDGRAIMAFGTEPVATRLDAAEYRLWPD